MRNRFNEETENQIASDECQSLALVNIDTIRNKKLVFYIPAYQRGYRWRPDEIEVLIGDLLLFMNEEGDKAKNDRCPFYCMQAVVVKNCDAEHNLEVIDGQQRLTTMLILLQALFTVQNAIAMRMAYQMQNNKKEYWLERNLYSINYETRISSSEWLFEITKAYMADISNGNKVESSNLKNNNSDYCHFVDAFDEAIKTFSQWGEDERGRFSSLLNKQIRFIWYNASLVDASDSNVDIFDRINATKIELNNAELVKALLLQGNHFGSETHLRDQMAIDWDRIEKRLQNPSFWGFVYSTRHPYRY